MSATLARPSRVLLADHAADARLLTRTALAGIAGIEIVAEAVDGADAVEKAAACQPDLVLLDLAMPRLSGLEALPLIRDRAPLADVIVVSASDSEHNAELALRAGALAYVRRSADPGELVETVRQALGQGDEADPDPDLHTVLGRLAHELRNPAIALGLIGQGIAADTAAGQPAAPALLDALQRQVGLVEQLADDLSVCSRAGRDLLAVTAAPVELRAALSAAAGAEPGVRVDCPAGLVAHADGRRLAQMLAALLANARRHGAAPVSVAARRVAGGVRIEVRDHGPGVPAAFVPHMFDEFTRAAEHTGGLGMGLAVVRALAAAHGGRVAYERRGKVTVVSVTLPDAG